MSVAHLKPLGTRRLACSISEPEALMAGVKLSDTAGLLALLAKKALKAGLDRDRPVRVDVPSEGWRGWMLGVVASCQQDQNDLRMTE